MDPTKLDLCSIKFHQSSNSGKSGFFQKRPFGFGGFLSGKGKWWCGMKGTLMIRAELLKKVLDMFVFLPSQNINNISVMADHRAEFTILASCL
jgi:hypothetical protein